MPGLDPGIQKPWTTSTRCRACLAGPRVGLEGVDQCRLLAILALATRGNVTSCCGPSAAERPFSPSDEAITKLPAEITTSSGAYDASWMIARSRSASPKLCAPEVSRNRQRVSMPSSSFFERLGPLLATTASASVSFVLVHDQPRCSISVRRRPPAGCPDNGACPAARGLATGLFFNATVILDVAGTLEHHFVRRGSILRQMLSSTAPPSDGRHFAWTPRSARPSGAGQ